MMILTLLLVWFLLQPAICFGQRPPDIYVSGTTIGNEGAFASKKAAITKEQLLAKLKKARIGPILIIAGQFALLGGMIILISAFKQGVVTGLLTLFVPMRR